MDMMAEKLGIDPFELRRRNAVYPGATSVGGEVLKYSMGMMDTINQIEKLAEALKEYEASIPRAAKCSAGAWLGIQECRRRQGYFHR